MRFVLILLLFCTSCAGQKYSHFTTPTPLPRGDLLIIGFQGGRDSWDDPKPGVARLAAELRELKRPDLHVELVENARRQLALQLIRNAFDRNRNRKLEQSETNQTRLIIYGMSFGGAAVVKLSRELEKENVPIMLTVQIDSVGAGDAVIPPNVKSAANFFQKTGKIINGEAPIRAKDPNQTEIIGNFEYDYKNSEIHVSDLSWRKKLFRKAHAQMDRDPEVWRKVKHLILEEIEEAEAHED